MRRTRVRRCVGLRWALAVRTCGGWDTWLPDAVSNQQNKNIYRLALQPLIDVGTSPLTELQRPEIVEVHDPLDPAACSDDDQRGDLLLLHQSEGR